MKNKKKYLILAVVLLGISLVIGYGITFAKYVSNSVWNYYLQSKEFYLDSEELKVDGKSNVNKQWDGGSVYFTLKNSLNDGLVTDYDISYRASCRVKGDSNSKCFLNGTASDTYEGVLSSSSYCVNNSGDSVDVSGYDRSTCEVNSYLWSEKVASKEMYFDVSSDSSLQDVVVEIRLESTSPYKKILTGEFVLKKDQGLEKKVFMNYHHYNDYDELVVSNSYSDLKCVNIKWDSAHLRLDYDKDLVKSYEMSDDNYINSIDIAVPSKDSVRYRFYPLNSEVNIDSFILTEKEQCGTGS